jgi:hypothetical protein
MRAMGLQPSEVTKVAATVARRRRMRGISRAQLFNIRHGAQATEGRMLLIIATLQEMTGYVLRASDLFNVEPTGVTSRVRRRSGEVAAFGILAAGIWVTPADAG